MRRIASRALARVAPTATAAPAVALRAPAAALFCTATPLRLSTPPTGATPTEADVRPKNPDMDTDGSHPDFKPKVVGLDDVSQIEIDAIKADIRDTIRDDDVVLFMKGVPEAPVCGFSKRLVDVLEELGLEYTSFDCLAHPVVRTYVKEVSDWPTIPQVFVKGSFCGGVDIVVEMAENGELQALLKKHGIPHREK